MNILLFLNIRLDSTFYCGALHYDKDARKIESTTCIGL